ncbi:uncharacterized protein N7511_009135 [Penicillium nucicola]|uniref:uncharacterized protein n=1 Tax=Penicillium nucicola TaxID=1850975 RepID=UPI002544E265|nr:uncharacterized protein N7511_009135 [Penicillium nucicola]KAJ5747439.1 hypothetical protein N7511_009135 [Penicillium nucicola]
MGQESSAPVANEPLIIAKSNGEENLDTSSQNSVSPVENTIHESQTEQVQKQDSVVEDEVKPDSAAVKIEELKSLSDHEAKPESPAESIQKPDPPSDDDLEPEKPVAHVKQLDFSDIINKRKRTKDPDVEAGGDTEADLSDSDISNFNPSESSSPASSEEDPPPSPTPKRGKKNPLDPSFKDPNPRRKNNKRRKKASDTEYTEHDSEDDIFFVPKYERNQLLDIQPRRRGKRQLEPEDLPINPDLGPQEQALAARLHACSKKASIPRHWQKDFMTLPEKLFFAADDDEDAENHRNKLKEGDFVLGAHKSSEFYAIRAFQELLQVCGHVRDFCNVLRSPSEPFIKRTIEKYLRWAVIDAGLSIAPDNIPMHVIYTKTEKEDSQEAITKFYKRLQSRATEFKNHILLSPATDSYWPALVGFFVTGPIVSVVTLDTTPQPPDANPPSADKGTKPPGDSSSSGINLLMYMDLSDMNRDVWGAMFLAILIRHIRDTMVKLAENYKSAWVAHAPGPNGDSGYFSDNDQ